MREIGIAHLSLLQLDPDAFVSVAAEAGYDFVGLRVRGATPAEAWPSQVPGSPMSRSTVARLADTGVRVKDIEFLSLDGTAGREQWLPMLEAGAAYGAEVMTVAGNDPDAARLTDTLAALAADAAGYGIAPALEAISYNRVATVAQALDVAVPAGARLMLDPLHLARGGTPVADIAGLSPVLVPVMQLCDGPTSLPSSFPSVPETLPRGMTADGEPRKVEARALRLAPGEGAFPLGELLRAVPAGTPVSLEVPDFGRAATLGPLGWATHLLESTRSLLSTIKEESHV